MPAVLRWLVTISLLVLAACGPPKRPRAQAGTTTPAAPVALDATDVKSVSARMVLPAALEPRRDALAREVLAGHAITARFAAAHGWSARMSGLFRAVEIFAAQEALWHRVLALNGIAPRPLPTKGLAGGVEKGILVLVTPEEYRRVQPDYAAVDGAYRRLIAHEIAHRLHVSILRGDDDAMGPVWFYEGFAVVASGDLRTTPVSVTQAWEATQAKGPGSYRSYAAALRCFMGQVRIEELVARAGRPDFETWLRGRVK
jgi:hypothetical protein